MMATSTHLSTKKKLGINGKLRRRLASKAQTPKAHTVQFNAETFIDKSAHQRDLEQHPFERYGKEALDFYAGIRDKDLRASLMKLYCWMREAARFHLITEVARLCAVQGEHMADIVYYSYEFDEVFHDEIQLSHAVKKATISSVLSNDLDRIKDFHWRKNFEAYSPSLVAKVNTLLAVGCFIIGSRFTKDHYQLYSIVQMRNLGSHYSMADIHRNIHFQDRKKLKEKWNSLKKVEAGCDSLLSDLVISVRAVELSGVVWSKSLATRYRTKKN